MVLPPFTGELARGAQDFPGQGLDDLVVPGQGFLLAAIGPDLVPGALALSPPSQLFQGFLQIPFLHL
jgi:hypothetical protein